MFNRKSISKSCSILFILVILLALAFNPQYGASAQAPAILYATPSGTGNCSTWGNACTLAAALTSAVSGDEIWVAAGLHRPTTGTLRSATFQLKSGVAVYGGFSGTETERAQRNPMTHVTILSGDLLGDDVGFTNNTENVYHVVMGANSAILDGFTITGGNANGLTVPDDTGGGMFIYQRNPSLTNLTFSYNSASTMGGGLYIDNGTPALTDVSFTNNSATWGGGMNGYASSPILNRVTFSGNAAQSAGGGLLIWSGGTTLLTNVTFSGNSATDHGGGMMIEGDSNATLTNVTFGGNTANQGGGIYNSGTAPLIRNAILWNNIAAGGGAQIYNSSTASVVTDGVVQDGCPAGSTCTNIIIADPHIGVLGNYGGATQTIPLLLGSSAIDTGNDSFCPATDQRSIARPQGAHCDIGAYEFVNLAPTDILLSNSTVAENANLNTLVGALSSVDPDPDNTFTYSLVPGGGDTDNASFTISGDTLRTSVVFDFETRPSYSVRIRTTDQGGAWYEEAFTITITNVNETPTDIQLSHTSVLENAAIDTPVGTLSSVDPDSGNTFTYSLVSGNGDTDNTSFNISGDALRTSTVFDYETRSSYSVRVRTTDQGGLSYEEAFTITVTDGNEFPTDIQLSHSSVAENSVINTAVGTLSSTDPDPGNTFTYNLVPGDGGADNTSFNISGNTLRTSVIFDFETRPSYSVRIRTTDQGGLSYEEAFTITITNANDAPVLASIANATIDEMAAFTFTASAIDVDPATVLTYSLTGSVPAGATISPTGGVFNWRPTEVQGPASFTFNVRVCDNGNPSLCDQQEITLSVSEVNLAPVAGNDAYSVMVNQTLSVLAPGVLINDGDADLPPNTLTAILVADPAHGTLTLNEDGSFTYLPNNWYGEDHFTYRVFDGGLSSPPATVTITVTPLTVFIPLVLR
ncbi:protein containg cadherin domain [Longilinea arvoryzae]|uniref:Protein containg cadherin domain n=1 Tax=Longilinea arvoryzae TaxID=360412 RepID=A0A0S7B8C4_9CHLR|nr:cadherin domain-containing protein [Longilinea arvoryzae]GAP13486.1 protein containg cadherin domain [Longilinea arvoryzae]